MISPHSRKGNQNLSFFFFLWLRWVFVAARRLSLVVGSRGYSSLRCTGFSLWWLLLLRSTGSRHVGFSSCGTRAQQLWLTGSRAQAQQLWHTGLVALWHEGSSWTRAQIVSPALAGGFLTTAPPGKSLESIFQRENCQGICGKLNTTTIQKYYFFVYLLFLLRTF